MTEIIGTSEPPVTETLEDVNLPQQMRPEDDVELTYPKPQDGYPQQPLDNRSAARAADYLLQRHLDDPPRQRRHVMLAPAYVPFNPTRIPAGGMVTRSRPGEGWWVHPWVSAATIAISALAFNGPPAAQAIHRIVDRIEYHATPPRDVPIQLPGKTVTISEQVASTDASGSFVVNQGAIRQWEQRLARVQRQVRGSRIASIYLGAKTSDEYGSDGSIGVVSIDNTNLGKERETAVRDDITADYGGKPPATIDGAAKEHVITRELKSHLEDLAHQAGYSTLYAAIQAQEAGAKLNPALASAIRDNFTRWRGVDVTAQVAEPGKTIPSVEHIPGKNNPPPGPEPWPPLAVGIPPARRRQLVTETAVKGTWALTPVALPWPAIAREDKEHVWVRFLREVLREDGTFERFPWAYTRKYLHLFRDGRIPSIMRSDYQAADGSDKSIYTLFVDHEPTDEELRILEEKIPRYAAIQGGRLGDLLSIVIHKSSEAGRSPLRPKRVGPGLDKQYGRNVLGFYAPLAGIVEIHLETDDPAELAAALEDFRESPAVTLDHEAGLHGASTIHGPLRVRRAPTWGIRHAYVPERDQFTHEFILLQALHANLASLNDPEAIAKQLDTLQFDIIYRDGASDLQTARVNARDQLLGSALSATIVGTKVTIYAGSSDLEYAAEAGAAGLGGETVPFPETGASVEHPSDGGNYANGYHPDPEAVRLAARLIGGKEDTYPIAFDHVPDVTSTVMHPFEDPLMAELIKLACNTRFPRARQMLAVLAGVAEHEREAA